MRNMLFIKNLYRSHVCDIMANNLATLYPCIENLNEAEYGTMDLFCGHNFKTAYHFKYGITTAYCFYLDL